MAITDITDTPLNYLMAMSEHSRTGCRPPALSIESGRLLVISCLRQQP